jgi:signal transduction histidine kinase
MPKGGRVGLPGEAGQYRAVAVGFAHVAAPMTMDVAMQTGGDKVNILLVDDQPGKLLTYEAILGELGENLIKAHSGAEALQYLLNKEFAVVLLDVCMPALDGFELASLIRQHPRCRKTAIIFISAVASSSLDRLKGYQSGAVDYVSVPVEPELLRARVSVFADLYRKTEAMERMNIELERRVAERTAQLEVDLNERKRLEKALMAADRRKDEFLATLSHELRNPLAAIRNAVQIMELTPLADPHLHLCREVIDRQVEHLSRLVDDLLEVSRITRGKFKLKKKPVEVATFVARAIETAKPLFDARGQRMQVSMPAERLVVNGDLIRLSQIVGNLLNNATKYSPDGAEISLRIEKARRACGEEEELLIRVKDNGKGIPAEMLSEVFDLFTQVDRAHDRPQGGLGIGLALVRKLAEMHGGSVDASSLGVGQGSEFIVRLPLLAEPALPAPKRAVTTTTPAAPRRILVVDDNIDAATSLALLLKLAGNETHTAYDGLEAVEASERIRPDVVLLDIGLPKLNGYQACRRIREQPWCKDLKIIAITGWGREQDRQQSKAAGFDGHMVKPVDIDGLMRLIGSVPEQESPERQTGLEAPGGPGKHDQNRKDFQPSE